MMRNLLFDEQKAFYKYSPTNLTKEISTPSLAEYKLFIRSRLVFNLITIPVN